MLYCQGLQISPLTRGDKGVCENTMKISYHPKLKELARKLRNNSTKSEIKLWQYLKSKRMMGYDFHRQKPIDNYIVDFFCNKLQLAIELDGYTHTFKKNRIYTPPTPLFRGELKIAQEGSLKR